MTKAFMLVPFFASLHQLAYAHKIMGRSQIRRGNMVSRFPIRKEYYRSLKNSSGRTTFHFLFARGQYFLVYGDALRGMFYAILIRVRVTFWGKMHKWHKC